MKNKFAFLFVSSLILSVASFAQKEKMTREEKDEKNQARVSRMNNKNDYVVFRRQILALKEFTAEKMKIPELQKSSKMPVKVTAVIDSVEETDDTAKNKILTGYIRQDIGDNSTNAYELTFDRTLKKIVSIKHTGESEEVEKEEKAAGKKPGAPKTIHKKNKDDDDDDDPDTDTEKPTKGKQKDKDDDKE